jgi:hypothetical protein
MQGVRTLILVVLAGALLIAPIARADLANLGPGSFTPLAPVITFSEVPLGTVNPVYTFNAIPGLGNVTVSFAGSFVGQTITGGFPLTLNPHQPTGPLTLDGGTATTVNDGAPGATSPTLSGSPTFNGPISMFFSVPVAAVGLKGGYFDALYGTTIEAYAADGSILGSITNSVLGFEFYGLQEASGANVISGISFFITGSEPAGFEIDDVTFGSEQQVVPTVPEPSSIALLVTVLGGIGMAGWRRRLRGR